MATRIEQYQALPEAVRNYFFNIQEQEVLLKKLLEQGVNEDNAFSLVLLSEDVVLKNLELENFVAKVEETAGIDNEKARAIARDLVGYRLLPLQSFVPEVVEVFKQLGGKEEDYPKTRIEKNKTTPEMFVRDVLNAADLHIANSTLQSRLEFILGSYVRGVRTKEQTIAMMARSEKVGGLELAEELGKKMLVVIDEKKGTVELEEGGVEREEDNKIMGYLDNEIKGKEVQPSQNPFTAERQKKEERSAQHEEQEAQVLAKRYAAMTGKAPIGPIVTGGMASARTSAAVSKTDELNEHEGRVNVAAKAVLRQSAPRPEPVLPRLSTISVAPSGAGERQAVSDVKYTPKLVGLLEELSGMTSVDFRRLSSDPEQAIMKIQDKIALLSQESYEKKVQGIKAWQSSPVNKLYVSLSQEMLKTGKPLAQVVDEWKKMGQEVLSPEEVRAIVKLNTSLRF